MLLNLLIFTRRFFMSFANFVDDVGTNGIFGWRAPEVGLSELFNGGKATQKTGTTPYNSTAAVLANGIGGAQLTSSAYLNATRPSSTGSTGTGNGNGGVVDSGPLDINNIYNKYNGGGTGGTGGGTSYNPKDIDYLNDQEARLRAQHGSADTALNNGLTQLGDSYNTEVQGTNAKRDQAMQDFGIKREDTTRAKDSALTRTNENARTLAEGLRRRLGLASGSGSSAFQFAAPGAVSKIATENRTGVLENFGTNFRDLATSENRAKTQFEELLASLAEQKNTRESDFRSGILEKKSQIDGNLAEVARQRALALGGGYTQVKAAMAPYTGAIDSRQAEIDGLFNRFRTPFTQKAVDTSMPTLRDYMVDRANIKAGQPGPQDPTAPYKNPFGIEDEEQPVALY